MKKIAVLVSGSGTNLQMLIDSDQIESGRIVLVVSNNPNAYALFRAEREGIKTKVMRPDEYGSREEYSGALAEYLTGEGIDLVVLAGFLLILSDSFIRAFENRIINVHPSLIPSFCGDGCYGLEVHRRALERGVRITGATVHFVNEITDGGVIILQKAVHIRDGDTPKTLQKRVMRQAEWRILPKAVEWVCSGKVFVEDGKLKKGAIKNESTRKKKSADQPDR